MLSLLRKTKYDKNNSRYFVRNWNEIFRNYRWMKLRAVWNYRLCQALYNTVVVIGIIIVYTVSSETLQMYQLVVESFNQHDYSEDIEEITKVDNEVTNRGSSNSGGYYRSKEEEFNIPILEPSINTTGSIVVAAEKDRASEAERIAKETAIKSSDAEKQRLAEEQARENARRREYEENLENLRKEAEARSQEAIDKANAVPDKPSILDVIDTIKAASDDAKETISSYPGGGVITFFDDIIEGFVNALGVGGDAQASNTEQALEIERGIMETLEKGGYRDDEGKIDVEALTNWIEHTDLPTNVNYGAGALRGAFGGENQPESKEALKDYAQALADYFNAKDEAEQAQQEAAQAQSGYEQSRDSGPTITSSAGTTTTTSIENGWLVTTTVTTDSSGNTTAISTASWSAGGTQITSTQGKDSVGGTGGYTTATTTNSDGSTTTTTTWTYTDSNGNTSTYTETTGGGSSSSSSSSSTSSSSEESTESNTSSGGSSGGGNVICTYVIQRVWNGNEKLLEMSRYNIRLGFKAGLTKEALNEYRYGLGVEIIDHLKKESDSTLHQLWRERIVPVWRELRNDPSLGFRMYLLLVEDLSERYNIDKSKYPISFRLINKGLSNER